MSPRAATLACALGALALAAGTASAQAPPSGDLLVRVAGKRVNLAGYGGQQVLGRAVARFGAPTLRRRVEDVACDVRWRPIGLRLLTANFGLGDACSNANGRTQRALVTNARWRTVRGLRVGDSVRRMRSLYPGARLRNRVWWLLRATSQVGAGARYPVLSAVVRDGEVAALRLWIGAAGD